MISNGFFPEIKGNFGFGCMRLPMNNGRVDYDEFRRMIDAFLEAGFNYFDTAHGYIGGQSETAIRDCLSSRISREKFLLTDKLTDPYFESEEDIRPFFMKQLELCGVDYFDFYLMHAQDAENYPKFKRCRAYETAYELKKEGLIRHLGLSFHDEPEVLDMILTEHPEVEIVQIQFNYLDYESDNVKSRRCHEVCLKHNKPIVVMEPVKGGSLVNLPMEADEILRGLNGGSNASYALRYAASFPNMAMIISGMSNMEQMEDNLSSMKEFTPVNEEELQAIARVVDIFSKLDTIPCTRCRYCVDENQCPMNIVIPDIINSVNEHHMYHSVNQRAGYNLFVVGGDKGRASDCIGCGMCERVCPQHLEIRSILEQAAELFEK